MKIELTVKKEFDVVYLKAKVHARYWEDSIVNGVEDLEGTLIPCREGDEWCPLIELETGIIKNWEIGKTADIHYKSCDRNEFILLDAEMNEVAKIEGYVIDIMCPKENGYGDYVIMDVDAQGKINDFKSDLTDFISQLDHQNNND